MFKGLKVIELASVLAGPDVGMFFAELGAKVIKVENKLTDGDVTRKWKSVKEDGQSSVSAYFSSVNYNKEYLLFDFTSSEELLKVKELIRCADIVISNFKSKSAIKFGLDYKSLKSNNPTLIYGEITGYGSENNRAAYDVVLQAETGYMSINGEKDSSPLKMPIALIDVLAAHQLKEGILVALLNKAKNNKGALVEVSLFDTAISSLKNQATNWLMGSFIPEAIGSRHPNIAPYGETFKTKDNRYIVLAIGNDKQFKTLLQSLDATGSFKDKFASNQLRVKNRNELYNLLAPLFLKLSKNELMKIFIAHNIPAGAINNIQEVFNDENAQRLVLEEIIDGINTKRVKTVVFKISD